MNLYTIYDKVAKEAGPIFEAKNDGVALRQITDMVKNQAIKISEYHLVKLGTFDKETVEIKPLKSTEAIDMQPVADMLEKEHLENLNKLKNLAQKKED